MDKQMWVEKYRPEKIIDVVGNEESKAAFINWLKSKRKQKAVLLYGPPGVGKTALVHAAARELKYRLIEMNASDTRTRKAIVEIAGPVTSLASLDEFYLDIKGSLLLFDEVDGIFGREDRGGVGVIVKLIKESQTPIVLTANTADIKKLRPITKVSDLIKFRGVRPPLIVALLQKMCKMEGVTAEKGALEAIAIASQGDVRSAVNDLQTLCAGKTTLGKEEVSRIFTRNRTLDVHKTLKEAFSASSPREAWSILNNSVTDYDTLLLAFHDNLPLRYNNPKNLAAAYEILSKADVFRGRIGTELWRLLPYVYNLLAQSATLNPKSYQPFNPIFPPTKFLLLNWTRRQRTLLEDICGKIASKCHVSKRTANLEFIPFLRAILKKNNDRALKISEWLELEDESFEYLRRMQ